MVFPGVVTLRATMLMVILAPGPQPVDSLPALACVPGVLAGVPKPTEREAVSRLGEARGLQGEVVLHSLLLVPG